MTDDIKIKCPKCGASRECERDPTDPEHTALVIVQCPECNGGDFDTPRYFDAEGDELYYPG